MAKPQSKIPGRVSAQPRLHQRAAEIQAYGTVWGQAILRRYIRPVAQRAGIQKRFGWHTFRHTYSTLLRRMGTEFKVMQELLRHSTLRSTLDVYARHSRSQTCGSGSDLLAGISGRSEWNVTSVGTK